MKDLRRRPWSRLIRSLRLFTIDPVVPAMSRVRQGPPLTGDTEAWAERMEQGMDVLLDHAINGFQGMPPMGMCFDCSEEDFIALIEFMSQG